MCAGVCGCVWVCVVNGETGDFDLHCKTNFRKPNEKNELCIQRCKHSRAAETELENRREKVERESSSRKCYEYAITHSQREAMRTEQPSASAGDKHPPIHSHPHPHPLSHPQQHRERTMQVASGYEKLFYGCFYSRLHLSLAPVFLCVCVRLKRFLYLAPPAA